MVTPLWWNFVWLNEGFASYYSNLVNFLVFPNDRWNENYLVNFVQPALVADAGDNTKGISDTVESFQDIEDFNYNKRKNT